MQLRFTSDALAEIIRERIRELHTIAPDSIGDRMHYSLLSCDAERGEFRMRCQTEPWMRNGPGTLHGGMCATVVDQAMGFIAYCLKRGEGTAPTVQMSTTYHRPLIPSEDVLIYIRVLSITKSLISLSAEAYRATEPDKLCLSATATYFDKSIGG